MRRLRVVVVSFLPDPALPGGDQPGAGPPAFVALIVMHIVVAAAAVPACRRVLPLPVR